MSEKINGNFKCKFCLCEMVHVTQRKCKCHLPSCQQYSNSLIKGTCTIFRKLSKTNLEQPDTCLETLVPKKIHKILG